MDSFLLDLDPLEDLPPLPLLTSPSSPLSLSTTTSLPSVDSDPCAAPPPSVPAPLPAPASPSPTELHARLAASLTENKALRTRVASLSRENRALRAQLRQSSSSSPSPSPSPSAKPLYRAARALAGAVRIPPSPAPPTAKRARTARPDAPTATTTMACALLLCGAFFSAPAILQSDNRTYSGAPAIPVRYQTRPHYIGPAEKHPFTPRVHPALPAPDDTPSSSSSPSSPALRRHPAPSVDYMLCEDGRETHRALSSCAAASAPGRPCAGPPQIISLVVPAAAAGLHNASSPGGSATANPPASDTPTQHPYPLAEVMCHVVSVSSLPPARAARIHDAVARAGVRDVVGVANGYMGMGMGMGMGDPHSAMHMAMGDSQRSGTGADASNARVGFHSSHIVASASASAAA